MGDLDEVQKSSNGFFLEGVTGVGGVTGVSTLVGAVATLRVGMAGIDGKGAGFIALVGGIGVDGKGARCVAIIGGIFDDVASILVSSVVVRLSSAIVAMSDVGSKLLLGVDIFLF